MTYRMARPAQSGAMRIEPARRLRRRDAIPLSLAGRRASPRGHSSTSRADVPEVRVSGGKAGGFRHAREAERRTSPASSSLSEDRRLAAPLRRKGDEDA